MIDTQFPLIDGPFEDKSYILLVSHSQYMGSLEQFSSKDNPQMVLRIWTELVLVVLSTDNPLIVGDAHGPFVDHLTLGVV